MATVSAIVGLLVIAALTASQLASAAGVEVSDVLSIVEGGPYGGYDASRFERFGDSAGGPSAFSTPIQPGMIDIEVTVYIEYLIS
ncbi:MAG: SIMPL domain-containing protein [Chloroflexota bacterium]|nr:SIMPL domain-containing protein [Chloroflexota bacterium]